MHKYKQSKWNVELDELQKTLKYDFKLTTVKNYQNVRDLFDAITESLRYDESTAAALVKDLAAPIGKNSNVPFMFYFFRIPPCTKHSPPRCETGKLSAGATPKRHFTNQAC